MIATTHELIIDIGEIPILVRTDNADFAHMLEDRYGEFVAPDKPEAVVELEIELLEDPGQGTRDTGHGFGLSNSGVGYLGLGVREGNSEFRIPDSGPETSDLGPSSSDLGLGTSDSAAEADADDEADVDVRLEGGRWLIERGSYRAEWDPQTRRGWVRQTANPYAIDGVLRILHSLILARQGGLLVHAASAVRNGKAYVFAGISGTGKTTISRLAPPDVTLLTDEISYVRDTGHVTRDTGVGSQESELGSMGSETRAPYPVSRVPAFQAYGTPFAGELARIGQKVQAPLDTLFLLKQGPENRIEPVSESQAARELMRHVLFFARDDESVAMVFNTVCEFVKRVPVRRLVFTKDASVWELIGIVD